MLQCVAVCCTVLQCDAACCSVSECVYQRSIRGVAVCCSVLQYVAVYSNVYIRDKSEVLQCVAV